MVAARAHLSEIRRWAETNIIVADGPLAGSPYRAGGGGQGRPPSPAWGEVLDAMDDPEAAQVVVRGSVQSGKTACLIVASLFHMAKGRSVLLYQPDDRLKRAMAARLLLWGRACKDEEVASAYEPKRPPHARVGAAGGRLEVISARESGAAVMRTASVVVVDELRLFHADLLADLIDRTAAYGEAGRLITASSAGYENECKTSTELAKSDSRRWFLRCPSCGRENVAAWANVVYKDRKHPVYLTPCCAAELDGIGFRHAVGAGRWKPTKTPMVERIIGFHADCFVSPFESLNTIARQWRRASAHQKQTTSMAEIISFQTGRLCVPFKPEAASGVTPEGLMASCREAYDPAVVPAAASVVVAAVDTQDARLEAEISAFGLIEVGEADASQVKGWHGHEFHGLRHGGKWFRLRRWALSYKRLHGDPGDPSLWNELAEYVETERLHASGVALRPVVVGIDSGGHFTQQVADFTRTKGAGYQALKGLAPGRIGAVLARRSVTADNLESYRAEGLLLIGTDNGKASVFSLMRQSIAGVEPRPMTWPMVEDEYGPEEYESIVSETLARTIDKRTGQTRLAWRKINPRNEGLDLLVYSLALVSHLGIGFILSEAEGIAAAAGKEAA